MPVILGDCLEVMKRMDAESVDAIVTDPPAGINFMSRGWDSDKGGRDHWIEWMTTVAIECLRVIKPGGHALVWSIPRTSHWTAMAWENAGWEVRDRVIHIFGSGFPKSTDISKHIDKRGGEDVGWFGPWLRKYRTENGISQKELCELGGFYDKINHGGAVTNWEMGYNLPTVEQFNKICEVLHLPFEKMEDVKREVVGTGHRIRLESTVDICGRSYGDYDITAPATDSAKQWNGWGTALKPAHEDWILLRKPVKGTIAQNVLKHGCGGINIDGCRVEGIRDRTEYGLENSTRSQVNTYGEHKGSADFDSTKGRFPANLILDDSEEVRELFPQSSVTGNRRIKNREQQDSGNTPFTRGTSAQEYTDSGSASRFFYCAKASKSERNIGCDALESKMPMFASDTRLHNNGDGTPRPTGATMKNTHPTVKPLALMRYLCRLITPPGGIILDPFAGSGSTGVAAKQEGFQSILIELEQESYETANARMRGTK